VREGDIAIDFRLGCCLKRKKPRRHTRIERAEQGPAGWEIQIPKPKEQSRAEQEQFGARTRFELLRRRGGGEWRGRSREI